MENKNSANYDGFSLVSGGLIYKLTSVFRGKTDTRKGLIRTAIALVLIIWLPVCILALFAGTLNDNESTISFFEDFLVHVRYLLIVPFLILIENLVDRTLIGYVQNSDRIIPNEQQKKFNNLVNRLDKLTDSYIPEIVMLVIVYGLIFINWNELSIFVSGRNYLFTSGNHSLSAAGWYYMLVSTPIFQLLFFRWLWRWAVWVYSIFKISSFKLHLDPLHADQMAGLEYINLVPLMFSFILIAPSAVFSASIGIDIIYHGAVLSKYVFYIAVYIFLLPIILYAPLVIFMPFMIRAKSWGIQNFGNLLRKHNSDYVNKWMQGNPPKDEELLGTMDNSSLSDINGSFTPVQGIKLIPVNYKMIVLSFVLNLLPYIPLVFTYYSASFLFNHFLESIL